jgi:hypothetical protein
MKSIADLQGQDLHWVQPNMLQPHFELRTSSGAVVASITRSGFINITDQVEAAGGHYRIAHKGFLNRIFEIRPQNGAEQPPLYVFHNTGAKLVLPDGGEVFWKKVGGVKALQWEWTRADGTHLLSLDGGAGERVTSHLRLALGAADEGTRLLLAMLGAYLILLYGDEAE